MDQETFLEDCLEAHHDLLTLERRVHDWICGLAGIEVVAEPGEPAPWERPGWDEPAAQHALASPAPETRGEDAFDPALFEPVPADPAAGGVAAEPLGEPLTFDDADEEPGDGAWDPEALAAPPSEPDRMARGNRPPRPAPGQGHVAKQAAQLDADNPWG